MPQPAPRPTHTSTPPAAGWHSWRRRVLILLVVATAVAVALGLLIDHRFLDSALVLAGAALILLMQDGSAPVSMPDRGRSPWRPGILRALSVLAGLGWAILAGSPAIGDLLPVGVLVAVGTGVLVAGLGLVLSVLFRAQVRGESIRAGPFPGLSAADRRRIHAGGYVICGLLLAAQVTSRWIPRDHLPVWGPIALVVGIAIPTWAWWATRLAARSG